TIQWLDASGGLRPLLAKPGLYTSPSFSPVGTRLAVTARDPKSQDIWTYDWTRDTMTRLTFGGGAGGSVWFPDGQHLVYFGDDGLYWIRTNGSGKPQLLVQNSSADYPQSFTPDGRWLAWGNWISPVEGDSEQWRLGKSETIQSTQSGPKFASFSPDGRWLA